MNSRLKTKQEKTTLEDAGARFVEGGSLAWWVDGVIDCRLKKSGWWWSSFCFFVFFFVQWRFLDAVDPRPKKKIATKLKFKLEMVLKFMSSWFVLHLGDRAVSARLKFRLMNHHSINDPMAWVAPFFQHETTILLINNRQSAYTHSLLENEKEKRVKYYLVFPLIVLITFSSQGKKTK